MESTISASADFSSGELEAAVTYGNVRAFYDPRMMSASKRAQVLSYDPEFPQKCKAFRSISDEHARVFFSWTDGKPSTPLASRKGELVVIPMSQFVDAVTFGSYKRKPPRCVGRRRNSHSSKRRLTFQDDFETTVTEVRNCVNTKGNQSLFSELSPIRPSEDTIVGSGPRTPTLNHVYAYDVDEPRTPEMNSVHQLIDAITPSKLPSRRRELLARSLLEFGVETVEDLRGFTYEQLRSEITLHAFTGVQLKRLSNISMNADDKSTLVHDNIRRSHDKASPGRNEGSIYDKTVSKVRSKVANFERHQRKHRRGQRKPRVRYVSRRIEATDPKMSREESVASKSLSSSSSRSFRVHGLVFWRTAMSAVLAGVTIATALHFGSDYLPATLLWTQSARKSADCNDRVHDGSSPTT